VRYAVRINDRRRITLELHAAPIDPAQLLAKYLFDAVEDDEPVQRAVICTSATLATNRNFEHFKHRCGIEETGEEHVLSTVFDFPTQSMLYQPALPAYNYRNPTAFYDAVASEIERLIQVSRGRTLGLFTSWSGLQQAGGRLQNPNREIIWPVRAQGDAPRDALLAWFKETPHSVLLATRSFWEGVDIPGDDLSLVVLDKMPFPTPGDPLHGARMKAIDEAGESSFGQYMLPLMTLALKQGFGRLIRRTSDSGVVAILDERLSSKGYGRQARNDLPPARFTREFGDVHRFYQDSLNVDVEFAVNVWALPTDGSSFEDEANAEDRDVEADEDSRSVYWRWQLLRLQDGKADEDEGFSDDVDSVADAEIYAMTEALTNLRQRIERAGRAPGDFAVEVRCSDAAAAQAESGKRGPTLAAWRVERDSWRAVRVVALTHHG
jgi:ATP-dependent DNA helicase DinG